MPHLQVLKIWVDSKIAHLEFVRDSGLGTLTPQAAQAQIKLLKELQDLFNLKDVDIKQLKYHNDI